MKRYFYLITVLFYVYPVCCLAQASDHSGKDSTSVAGKILLQTDTVRIDSLAKAKLQLEQKQFMPNSTKAVLLSAVFPGLGQIYNRKYWKLPLVYGSFIGCAYAITWNSNQYNGYENAYSNFLKYMNGKPSDDGAWDVYRYGNYLSQAPADWSPTMQTQFSSALKSAKDYYRRYRDMSIIITVAVYALWMIDAYVDAQLFDFDISPDLSMHISPVMFDQTAVNTRSVGMQLSFGF